MKLKSGRKLLKLSRGQWISVAVLASSLGLAAAVTIPNTFVTGAVISSSQMNDNFTALATQSGIRFSNNTLETAATSTDTVMQALTITAPTAGFLVVNTSGYFSLGATGGARCSITTGTTVDFNFLIIAGGGTGQSYMAFAGTRGFAVSAGANTFNLVCNSFAGTPSVGRPVLTAIFSPTQL